MRWYGTVWYHHIAFTLPTSNVYIMALSQPSISLQTGREHKEMQSLARDDGSSDSALVSEKNLCSEGRNDADSHGCPRPFHCFFTSRYSRQSSLLVWALLTVAWGLTKTDAFLTKSTRGRLLPRGDTLLRSSTSSSSSNVAPADERYYSFIESPLSTAATSGKRRITLTRFLDQALKANPDLAEMTSLLLAVQMACKTISNLVHRAGLAQEDSTQQAPYADGRYYSMTRLDQLSTTVLKNALQFTGKCQVQKAAAPSKLDVPEHQPGVLLAKLLDSNLVACLDPLDGSGNADASICTGTVFGVFESSANATSDSDWMAEVLQPAQQMKAAGYCLYSSATVLVFTLGDDVQGFTLDPQTQEFVLTHSSLTIPPRGTVYSCNEANAPGWNPRVREYFEKLKTGQAKCTNGQRYALRYVGSLVGDVHRTLLYGGLFGK